MTAKKAHSRPIPVVDVDQAFPAMVESPAHPAAGAALDQGPAVRTAIRNVLGVRSREQDPKAFVDALTAAFRLVKVEGHTESRFVPRGYAIQADLGAVSGGQASLYRRATIARAEILRILDGLTALRGDADADDMEAYRLIVRNGVQSLVDEMGAPGGPRVGMVDSYFDGLVGRSGDVVPDTVGGQLGALRDRFGLIDDNVNTIEEEGLRTSYWTLVDLVTDLGAAWRREREHFGGASGSGFLGTELIHLSRLMEAASDQVEELESVLDSVLIGASERRTIRLDDTTNLTLDGLLTWLTAFLSDEGRRLAQDAGRDGIVAALTPAAVALADTFKRFLADALVPPTPLGSRVPLRYLPASCCQRWPAGMYAARVQIAVSGLCRLLLELAWRAQRIGRWAGVILVDVTVSALDRTIDDGLETAVANVEFRGMNLRSTYVPAFVPQGQQLRTGGCRVEDARIGDLILPLDGTTTADDESISALFRLEDIEELMKEARIVVTTEGVVLPASDAPVAVVDLESERVVHAPVPTTWPRLVAADDPHRLHRGTHGVAEEADEEPEDEPDVDVEVEAGESDGTAEQPWWVEAREREAAGVPPPWASGPLGAWSAQRRTTDAGADQERHAAVEEARAAALRMEVVNRTLADLVAQAEAAEVGLADAAGAAAVEVDVARGHLAGVIADIEQAERNREPLSGARRGALTAKIHQLTAQAEALETEIEALAAAAAATSEEHGEARAWVEQLRTALDQGSGVDDYLQHRLASMTDETSEEGN